MEAKSRREIFAENAELLIKATAGDATLSALVSAQNSFVVSLLDELDAQSKLLAEQKILIDKLTALVLELNAKLDKKSKTSRKANN